MQVARAATPGHYDRHDPGNGPSGGYDDDDGHHAVGVDGLLRGSGPQEGHLQASPREVSTWLYGTALIALPLTLQGLGLCLELYDITST